MSALGVGTMGRGIAQVAAMAGHEMMMCNIETVYVDDGLDTIESNLRGGTDRDKVTPDKIAAMLDRPSGTTSLETIVTDTDLAVEAVPEDMELRRETVMEVESLVDNDAVIAPNMSSLFVIQMLSALERPKRNLGLHFFNSVHIVGLVEIAVTKQTSESALVFAIEFIGDIGKIVVEVGGSPGFASSWLSVALGVEAMCMVQEDVTSPADVDIAMELGYSHLMGPLGLGNVVGLDVRLGILEYLREGLGERFYPPQVLKRRIRAGKLGKKTGKGSYVWEDGEIVGMPEDVMD